MYKTYGTGFTHKETFRYLFWIVKGPKGGLYRLDLGDISNHRVQAGVILSEPHLGAFTVDHTNFRLLVANEHKATIYSVSLDG